jgi:phosphatidylglycerol lysyltransferase
MFAVMSDVDRSRALEILRTHGWATVSFQLLESEFRYWFDDDAFVAYVDTGSAWVAGGAPVASAARLQEVAERFVAAAHAARRRASFFACEHRFINTVAWPSFRIGEQPVWRPAEWSGVVSSTSSLRYQLRRAARKGVHVNRLAADEVASRRSAIDALALEWLASRRMSSMGFLVQLEPTRYAEERVMFTAEHHGKLVGFLSAVPVFARRRWFVEDILRTRGAPNGTTELLIDAAMRAPEVARSESLTLGLAPLAGGIAAPLRFARAVSRPLYDFHGLHAFKRKLRPQAWEPVYVCSPSARWRALTDGLTAFARGSLLRFAVRTLLRRPPQRLLPGA